MSPNFFTYVYDALMDKTLYHKWLEYTQKYAKDSPKKTLDLACGTGELAILLSQSGYEVTGLDVSEDMLSLAYDKQLEKGVRFPLVEADMRTFSLEQTYDLVTCYNDSLCYIETKENLKNVFNRVYTHLEEGGWFLFDVHSVFKTDTVFPGYQYHAELEDMVFVWSSYEGNKPHSVEHELLFFVEEGPSLYKRYDELIYERTHPLATYQGLLKEAGFQVVKAAGDFGEAEITDTTERWFFACQK